MPSPRSPRRIAKLPLVLGIGAVAVLAVLPRFVESPYALHLMILFFLAVIMGEAWNLIGGYGGQY